MESKVFFFGILVIAVLGNDPELLPHFADKAGVLQPLDMTEVIQMIMLLIAASILIFCKVKAKEVGNSQIFRSGMVALLSDRQMSQLTQNMGDQLSQMQSSVTGTV